MGIQKIVYYKLYNGKRSATVSTTSNITSVHSEHIVVLNGAIWVRVVGSGGGAFACPVEIDDFQSGAGSNGSVRVMPVYAAMSLPKPDPGSTPFLRPHAGYRDAR
jgi:hypothetical protein